MHQLPPQTAQRVGFVGVELAGYVVNQAKGSYGQTVSRDQRTTCVKPNVWRTRDQWVGRKAVVGQGVLHHHQVVVQNGVRTKGHTTVCGRRVKPPFALEPLPVLIQQRHQGDWHTQHACSQGRDIVKILLSVGVEYLVGAQPLETCFLVERQWSLLVRFHYLVLFAPITQPKQRDSHRMHLWSAFGQCVQ
ncbi:MAG: hypothetical protein Q8S32_00470 [Burkholderiaceae bacterium]|nr:hypothetical protein [Burkholderiaceae bacterium]